MHVNGLGSVPNIPSSPRANSPQPIDPQNPAEPKRSEDGGEIPAESLSGEGGEASDARELRLAQIKAAIEAGEYETQDKLDAALSRLFEELRLEDDEKES